MTESPVETTQVTLTLPVLHPSQTPREAVAHLAHMFNDFGEHPRSRRSESTVPRPPRPSRGSRRSTVFSRPGPWDRAPGRRCWRSGCRRETRLLCAVKRLRSLPAAAIAWSGSVGDRRDDRLADQELGVIAFLVDVAGEDHDQVQVGDDLDQLAGEPSSEEAPVSGRRLSWLKVRSCWPLVASHVRAGATRERHIDAVTMAYRPSRGRRGVSGAARKRASRR